MILSFELTTYCLISGAIYLLIVDLVWNRLESFLPTSGDFPPGFFEQKSLSWFASCFIVEFIFLVLMPTAIYDRFYMVIPFSGIRGGVSVGLFLFMFGVAPFAILLLFRMKLPAVYVLYQVLGMLIRIIGALAIIGYLYSL